MQSVTLASKMEIQLDKLFEETAANLFTAENFEDVTTEWLDGGLVLHVNADLNFRQRGNLMLSIESNVPGVNRCEMASVATGSYTVVFAREAHEAALWLGDIEHGPARVKAAARAYLDSVAASEVIYLIGQAAAGLSEIAAYELTPHQMSMF